MSHSKIPPQDTRPAPPSQTPITAGASACNNTQTTDNTRATTAPSLLKKAQNNIRTRGKERDKQDGERSMRSAVLAFNALTGHKLTEVQGWKFMAILKLARASGGALQPDDYIDGAAYMALAGEAALQNEAAERGAP